jgi:hypothetical protein
MKKQILIFVAIIGLFACNENHTDSEKTTEQSNKVAPSVQLDFVKTFEGQINNKYDIVLKITSNSGKITGNYFYKTEGTDIQVKGNLDNLGKFALYEYDSKGNQTGLFSGTMVNNNKIEGNWSKPNGDKAMTFVLIESNSQYESSKTQINDEKYKSISGYYESEFNSTDTGSFYYASVNIEYSGNNKFTFEIATGHESGCTGMAFGTATIDYSGIGKYSGDGCKLLTFKFTSTKLTIDETECDLHGMRCYFSGEYLKTK